MADTVEVVFGAKIDGLISGVNQVRSAIEGIKASTDKVSEGAKGFLEGLAGAVSVEGIRRLIVGMSELGDAVQKASDLTGLSVGQVANLGAIAKLTGSSLEGMTESIGRMTLNIQRAATNALDPARQGLNTLGLKAKDLIGIPADQFFLKLATAVERFNPGLNLTNALMVIGGRTMAQMIPLLRLGADGFKAMQEKVRLAQDGLEAATPGMADTNTKIGLLSLSFQSFAARLFNVFKPAIDAAIEWMTKLVQGLSTERIISGLKTITDAIATMMSAIGTFAINTLAQLQQLMGGLDQMATKMSLIATGAVTGGALGMFAGGVGAIPGAIIGGGVGNAVDNIRQWFNNYAKTTKDGDAQIEAMRQQLEKTIARFKETMGTLASGLDGKTEPGKGGVNAPAMNLNPGAGISAAATQIESEIRLLRSGLEQKKSIYQLDADFYQITQSQKTQMTADAVNAEYEQERALLQKEAALYAGMPQQHASIMAKIKELEQRNATDTLKINQDAMRDRFATLQEFGNALQSSFNGQLRGLLAGTTSFKNAFKSILGDMVIFFIQAVEKMVVNWIIGKVAMTTATVEGEAAKVAAVTAGSSAQMAAQLPLILKNIAASIGSVFAGVSAFLAPAIGPAAPAAAAGVAAGVQASALALVGSAEQGAYEVKGGLWQLHDNETVLPAPAAQAFRDMAEGGGAFGGGGGMHFHGMLIDGQSIARFARDNAGVFSDALRKSGKLKGSTS